MMNQLLLKLQSLYKSLKTILNIKWPKEYLKKSWFLCLKNKSLFMKSFFILILITNISHAKAVIAPVGKVDGNDLFVTVNDLNQLKIMFLLFALTTLYTVGKELWNWIRNKDSDVGKRIDKMEEKQDEILTAIQKLEIHLAHVKDNKVTEMDVRSIVRDEYEFIQKHRK